MFATFNLGIGCHVVDEDKAETVMELLRKAGEQPYRIGAVVPGEGVFLC
jgi:phosphoribosylaminoimidazole (AIR) synthetase